MQIKFVKLLVLIFSLLPFSSCKAQKSSDNFTNEQRAEFDQAIKMLSTYPPNEKDCSVMPYMSHLVKISDDPKYRQELILSRLNGKAGSQIIEDYKNNKCITSINKNVAEIDTVLPNDDNGE